MVISDVRTYVHGEGVSRFVAANLKDLEICCNEIQLYMLYVRI